MPEFVWVVLKNQDGYFVSLVLNNGEIVRRGFYKDLEICLFRAWEWIKEDLKSSCRIFVFCEFLRKAFRLDVEEVPNEKLVQSGLCNQIFAA